MLNNLLSVIKLSLLGYALGFSFFLEANTASPTFLHFYHFASRLGEIEPCGCEATPRGGVVRLQNALSLDPFPKILVDAGDSFFASERVISQKVESERLKAIKLAEAYRLLGLSALAPSLKDFALGSQFVKELEQVSKATFLTSDLIPQEGKETFTRDKIVEKNGIRFGIFSLSEESPLWKELGYTRQETSKTIEEALRKFKSEKVDYIACLSHLGFSQDEKLVAENKIDIVIGIRSLEGFRLAVERGTSWIAQQAPMAKEISFFEIGSKKIQPITHDLDASYDGKNLMSELVKSYHSGVKDLAVKKRTEREPSAKIANKKKSQEKPFVANPFYCKTCHEKQFDFWAGTKHSSAYLVLFSKNQHFDPECIGCHSLGFLKPNGFSDVLTPYELSPAAPENKQDLFIEAFFKEVFSEDKSEVPLDSRKEPQRYAKLQQKYHRNLKKLFEEKKLIKWHVGVSCEHCHGNRQGHPSPQWKKVKIDEANCRACHRPPNAPEFDPSRIKEVSCPRIKG